MIIPLFPGGNAQIRRIRAGLATGVILAALLALPGGASAGSTRLADAAVSPRAGTTTTVFTFSVTYVSKKGMAADRVTVLVDGVAHTMSRAAGGSERAGETYRYATTLPRGAHGIRFHATAGDHFSDDLDGGSVVVGAPRPRPTPEPTKEPPGGDGGGGGVPLPTPTPRPHPSPTPVTLPVADPGRDGGPDDVGGVSGMTPEPTPSPTPAAPGGAVTGPGGGSGDGGAGSGATGTAGTPPRSGRDVEMGGWGDLTVYLEKLGIGGDASPSVRLLVSAVSSAAGVTMLMAFLFFGKRRRDGEPPAPDEVLSAAAARGTGQAATAGLVPDGVPPAFVDPEAMMPRWRRPSLLEARKMDPLRSATAASTQSFEHGAVGLVDGYERRLIRYHVVRLLDKPDELNATEIGVLSHGDEVQLLERASTYWRVLCPDGQQGWIHKMTLGEVVGATPPPSARDTWATNSVQAEEVDDDVLMAFMTARGRA